MKIKPLNAIEKSIEDYVVSTCGLTYSVHYTGTHNRETHNRNNWTCDGWLFTIKGQTFDYFTGLGHRKIVRGFKALNLPNARHVEGNWEASQVIQPPIAGLLYSLILDSDACNESFVAWCNSLGYDTDSRKALKIYEQCQQSFDKLLKVFTTAQIEHITGLLEGY